MARVRSFKLIRHTSLAVGLCLLVMLFALEAKLASYTPLGVFDRDIREAKALPADTSQVAFRCISTASPINTLALSIFLMAFATKRSLSINLKLGIVGKRKQALLSDIAFFSLNLFSRPPPAR